MICFKSTIFCVCFIIVVTRSEPCTDEGLIRKTKTTEFVCIFGQWSPVACLLDNEKRVEDGKVMTTENYILQCQKMDRKEMTMVAIACVKNGRTVAPAQTVIVGHAYYTCQPKKNSVALELTGCVGPNGQKVPEGSTVDVDRFVYKCHIYGEAASLQPSGCIYLGKRLELNETVKEILFWIICRTDDRSGIRLDIGGCMDDGLPLNPNEIFHKEGFVYKCIKANDTVRYEGIGCLEVTPQMGYIEHMIGEKWFEGHERVKYEIECSKDISGVFKWATRCLFMDEDHDGQWVDPMCMKKVGQRLYQCIRIENQGLKSVITEQFTDQNVLDAQKNGLEFCK